MGQGRSFTKPTLYCSNKRDHSTPPVSGDWFKMGGMDCRGAIDSEVVVYIVEWFFFNFPILRHHVGEDYQSGILYTLLPILKETYVQKYRIFVFFLVNFTFVAFSPKVEWVNKKPLWEKDIAFWNEWVNVVWTIFRKIQGRNRNRLEKKYSTDRGKTVWNNDNSLLWFL